MRTIISPAELESDLARGDAPVLLDVRWEMGGPPGRAGYDEGHLPGAVFVDLEAELAGPPGPYGRHPLPAPDVFAAAMRRAGVTAARPVVTYDGGQGWGAARAWWMLCWTGHPDVRVLDGGLAAWQGPVTTEVPEPEEGDFDPQPGAMPTLDAGDAAELARRGLLLDARSGERYRGEVEPVDPVAGHIPGAVSAPTQENVDAGGRLRDAEALHERFRALGAEDGTDVGVYCGSGVSAAHEILALSHAGIDAALYVGSWSEWTADATRPVATGRQPG